MDLKTYILENKPKLESFCENFIKAEALQVKSSLSRHASLVQELISFSTKGKMLRGNFVSMAHDMYEGKNKDASISAGAALELNQSGLLIHDDIMDNDDMRRGEKSMHAKHGIPTALLMGDIAFFVSYEILSKLEIDPAIIQEIIKVYSKEMFTVSDGQLSDNDFAEQENEPSEEDIVRMYLHKTGRYTFVLPFIIGALIAGADKNEIKKIETFGENLGILFQMKDDELGVFQDEEKTGKPAGSDIRENKKTLVRAYIYAGATEDDKIFLDSCFGNADLKKDDLEKLREIATKNNVQEKITEIAKEYANKAFEAVETMKISDDYKKILMELIGYSLQRTS